ncbi:MAG TPA: YciI family protein [Ktedonobacterales bacterium]|nr:YciI family protein [Ktedonobacterales bacterium]
MEFTTYYVMLLRKGPNWTAEPTPALQALIVRHMTYLQELREAGKTLASGPVTDGSDLHGVSIYCTATMEEAQALAHADPAIQAGHFAVELHPWFTPAGQLPAAPLP